MFKDLRSKLHPNHEKKGPGTQPPSKMEAAAAAPGLDPPPPPLPTPDDTVCGVPAVTTSTAGRSVQDFGNANDLRDALMSLDATGQATTGDNTAWMFAKNERALKELLSTTSATTTGMDLSMSSGRCASDLPNSNSSNKSSTSNNPLDWILQNYDPSTSQPQDVETELRRLLVLRSFLLLDHATHSNSMQASLDGITALAQQTFGTPYCLISLVDLGRQWFLSKQGPLDATETPRNISFCTHCIQTKLDVLEVTDATVDPRFQDNPLVTGAPFIKYYAGVPLTSPEGYRLGTLCVIDTKVRPALSPQDRTMMQEMAHVVVDTMVQHRRRMSLWFQNLVTTHVPELVLQQRDGSDEESTPTKDKHADHNTDQVDEDFEAFLQATNDLSLEEIVQLLQKHDNSENEQDNTTNVGKEEPQHVPLDHTTPKRQRSVSPPTSTILTTDHQERRPTKRHSTAGQKTVRIVEEANQVVEVDSWKEHDELWWSPEEMYDIRQAQIEIVQWFRNHCQVYVDGVKYVMRNKASSRRCKRGVIKAASSGGGWEVLCRLDGFSFARGLEGHIVDLLSRTGKELRRAVLREQWQWLEELQQEENEEDDLDLMEDAIRGRSRMYSSFAARFAQNLARCDRLLAHLSDDEEDDEEESLQGSSTRCNAGNDDHKANKIYSIAA